jgi:cytochrome c oxidase cbb3-type subunit 3
MKNKSIILMAALLLTTTIAMAQAAATPAAAPADNTFYLRLFSYGLAGFAGLVALGALMSLSHLLNVMIKMQQLKIYEEHGIEAFVEAAKVKREPWLKRVYKQWTNVAPIEKENDILFDHNYDGIRELDNSLPPWWVALFAITVVFSIGYLYIYHFSGIGIGSKQEYETEVKVAKKAVKAYLATQADLVDESNVTVLTSANDIATGKSIYMANCVPCHGANGEGGVGPNMTDDYWIHGGDIGSLFKTVKYGVPEKGMISWQAQIKPAEMQKVVSYIWTLYGTKPANGKAPQGVEVKREEIAPAEKPESK